MKTKAVKQGLVDAIERAIEAAPPDCHTKVEVPKKALKKWGTCGSTHDRNHHNRWKAVTARIAEGHRAAGVEKITFKAGPVSYTVWNTRENLSAFLVRVKRAFP